MQPVNSASDQQASLASTENEPQQGQFDGRQITSTYSSLPALPGRSPEDPPTTSGRRLPVETVAFEDRAIDKSSVREKRKPIDIEPLKLFTGEPKEKDHVAAKFAKLGRESPVGKDDYGLTFTCQTSSWGVTNLAFTFTSCDLAGNPKATNDIGVQLTNADALDSYSAFQQDFKSIQHSEIVNYASSNNFRVQYDPSEVSKHGLAVSVLQQHTAFSIKLKIETLFSDGIPVAEGEIPRQLLLFVTCNDMVEFGVNGGRLSKPATDIITLDEDDQEVTIHGTDGHGKTKSHFDNLAQIWSYGTFSNARVSSVASALTKDFRNGLRIMVTPAVVFDVLAMDNHSNSAMLRHNRDNEQGAVVSSAALGAVKLKTIPTARNIRLLPSSMIDVITRDALGRSLFFNRS